MKKEKVIKVKIQRDYKLVVPHRKKKRAYLSDKEKEAFWSTFSRYALIDELTSNIKAEDYDTDDDFEIDLRCYDEYSYKDLIWECFDEFILYKDSDGDITYERRKR